MTYIYIFSEFVYNTKHSTTIHHRTTHILPVYISATDFTASTLTSTNMVPNYYVDIA